MYLFLTDTVSSALFHHIVNFLNYFLCLYVSKDRLFQETAFVMVGSGSAALQLSDRERWGLAKESSRLNSNLQR
jgi:hypothetical protein